MQTEKIVSIISSTSSKVIYRESREMETSKGFGGVGKTIVTKTSGVMDNMRSVHEAKKQCKRFCITDRLDKA